MRRPAQIIALLLASTAICCPLPAQERAAPSEGEVPLEQVLTKAAAIDQEFLRKAQGVRAIVEQEAAAKRISEPTAQSLLANLRTLVSGVHTAEIRMMLRSVRLPGDTVVLADAFKELELVVANLQSERTALARQTVGEMRRRVSAILHEPSLDPGRVEALLRLAEGFQDHPAFRMPGADDSQTFATAARVLRALKQLLDAEKSGEVTAISAALSQLRVARQYDGGALLQAPIQARIERALEPFQAALATAQNAVRAAIEGKKPAKEVFEALSRLEEAIERYAIMTVNGAEGARDHRALLPTYYAAAGAMQDFHRGDMVAARKGLRDVHERIGRNDPKPPASLLAFIGAWEREINDRIAASYREENERVRGALMTIKTPAELDRLAIEVARAESSQAKDEPGALPAGFSSQLAALAAAWSTGNMSLLQQRTGERVSAPALFVNEIAELRRKIERDLLSRLLKLPELNKSPMAEQPVAAALETYCDELARSGDWRRLLNVLEVRANLDENERSRSRPSDEIATLRAFFAGQNFELAERWSDAAQFYKTVLGSASARAPIKEAAERLKTIGKEQPEAVSTGGSSVLPRPAQIR